MRSHDRAAAQSHHQGFGQPLDSMRMCGILGRHGDQRPFEELDSLVREGAGFDEAIVFRASKRSDALR